MAEIQYNTSFNQSEMDPYFVGIGRVSMAAAHLDMMVNHSIWRLANVPACHGLLTPLSRYVKYIIGTIFLYSARRQAGRG